MNARRNLYGDTIRVLALLTITDEDGTKQTIKTDLSWHASADGPTLTAELYDGEVYDSRLEVVGWSEPSFDDSEWLAVKQLPPLRGMRMLEEQYPGAQAWIDSAIPRNEDRLWNRSSFQYADWLYPLSPPDAPANATTHKHLVADSYLIQMTRLLSQISSALNKMTEAEKGADSA